MYLSAGMTEMARSELKKIVSVTEDSEFGRRARQLLARLEDDTDNGTSSPPGPPSRP